MQVVTVDIDVAVGGSAAVQHVVLFAAPGAGLGALFWLLQLSCNQRRL